MYVYSNARPEVNEQANSECPYFGGHWFLTN